MNKAPKSPATLQEAIIHYSDFDNCQAFMIEMRWPDGRVRCPRCGSEDVSYLPNARVFKCYEKHEKVKFSLKVGTIFEDSPLGLDKWLPVMWMLVNCKNGVSSWEIHRSIGVTQKTAWFMLQRARLAMQDDNTGGKLGGEVEVDETFIGGKARNMHKDIRAEKITGRGPEGKAIVAAVLERGGKALCANMSETSCVIAIGEQGGKEIQHGNMNGSARPATSVTGILDSVSDVIEGGRVAPRPNPEAIARAKRRTYTGEYKQQILAEADAARGSGEIRAVLRRHGLYSSHLTKWRQERKSGMLGGLKPSPY